MVEPLPLYIQTSSEGGCRSVSFEKMPVMMKKRYSRPDIAFDSFLSTSIAGNCEAKTDTKGGGERGYPMNGLGSIFLLDMQDCKVIITEDQSLSFNGFCYHVPTENCNLFNS